MGVFAQVIAVSIFYMVVDLAGGEMPEVLDGRSLVPALLNGAKQHKQPKG